MTDARVVQQLDGRGRLHRILWRTRRTAVHDIPIRAATFITHVLKRVVRAGSDAKGRPFGGGGGGTSGFYSSGGGGSGCRTRGVWSPTTDGRTAAGRPRATAVVRLTSYTAHTYIHALTHTFSRIRANKWSTAPPNFLKDKTTNNKGRPHVTRAILSVRFQTNTIINITLLLLPFAINAFPCFPICLFRISFPIVREKNRQSGSPPPPSRLAVRRRVPGRPAQ